MVVSDATVPDLLAFTDLVASGADAVEVIGDVARAAGGAGIDVGYGVGLLGCRVGAATGGRFNIGHPLLDGAHAGEELVHGTAEVRVAGGADLLEVGIA